MSTKNYTSKTFQNYCAKNNIIPTQPEESDAFTDEIDKWLTDNAQDLDVCMFCTKKLHSKEEMFAGFCYKCM